MKGSAAEVAARRWRLGLLDRADTVGWATWALETIRQTVPRGERTAAVARVAAAARVSPATVYRWAAADRAAKRRALRAGRIHPGYVFRWHWPRLARAAGIPVADDPAFKESDLLALTSEEAAIRRRALAV